MGILDGKVTIVTGASRGIGKVIAELFAAEGAKVVCAARTLQEGERSLKGSLSTTVSEIQEAGGQALAITADVTDSSQVDRMVQAAISEFGKVDVLINNAGPQPKPRRPLWEMTDEDWHSEMDVVLTSAFYCCRAVSRHMVERQQGKIINIASGFGLRGLRYEYTYCTGKGGMIQLTKALALTWAKNGINVNCIAPGFIGVRHSNTEEEQKFFEERGKFIPVGYVGSPEDVAYLAVFLASEASDYMTGAVVIIDGGAMADGYAPAEYEPARAI